MDRHTAGTEKKEFGVGLAGPMCEGKNLAGSILKEAGCAVIDADEAAHDAAERLRGVIIERFGRDADKKGLRLLKDDGTLNRRALGRIVFSDPAALGDLEQIIHPAVDAMMDEFIRGNAGRPVVLNATVLYKTPTIFRCACIIFVDAPCIVRFFRAKKRDRLSFLQILKRFYAQKDIYAQYRKINVDIYRVKNTGNAAKLKRQLTGVLARFPGRETD